ncbi:response regulator transcription factor [Paenibacillus caseinilyticus]|uniref:Chemotaxis protein CheY n=1 Tax=Paenibacillus mucilaginosus K02 TaxID=997761 RepID=I0BNP9_9BACL|nr:helix-turn-helix domain-containing protein [Paenibacillus mucilaginosus]AFH63996.1 chemotaxis protein CheY [Paenibacillus mucilaginosus K02]
MWTLLLVEDEPYVRETIKSTVDWSSAGFRLVGEAEDGAEALELIGRLRPDLVICDIVMPVMDGIEVLEKAKAAYPESRFIMLTCMNEFEYARSALEHGASGYLLKLSLSPEALLGALSKAAKELERERLQREAAAAVYLQQHCDALWARRLHAGAAALPAMDAAAPAEGEPPALSPFPYVSVLTAWTGTLMPAGKEAAALEECFGGERPYVFEYERDGITTRFYWSRVRPPSRLRAPEEAEPAVWLPEAASGGWEEAWLQTLNGLDEAWYSGARGLLPPLPGRPSGGTGGQVAWEWERDLWKSVELRQRSTAGELLGRLWKAMEEGRWPSPAVKAFALQCDRTFAKMLGAAGGPAEELVTQRRHAGLQEALYRRLAAYEEASAESANLQTDHAELNKVIRHIHGHLHEDLNLTGLARFVNMDPHYFSKLFKKKTGENLISYVQRQRVEQAKKLLLETNMPVKEIGERLGFENENYFFRTFKRWTNETPGAFRKTHGGRTQA